MIKGRWLLVVALFAAPAFAQEETVDPSEALEGSVARTTTPTVSRGRGTGIALSQDGDARLHLTLDAAVGFDSNPYAIPLSRPDFAGDALIRLRPGLELQNPGALLSFNSWAYFDWGAQPGIVRADTSDFFLYQGGGNADIEVNRGGAFSFALADTLTWNRDPGVVAIGTIFNRLNNSLRAGMGFRPGGGTLRARLVYDFRFEKWFDFDGTASALIRRGGFDQMAHTGSLRLDWRFFPRTGAFLNLTGGVHTYPFDNTFPTSFPVNASVGLMGQFTSRLSGLVRAGYGNTLVLDTEGIDGVFGAPQIANLSLFGLIGQGELRFLVGDRIRVSGGFIREFAPAPVYQYVGNNRFYISYLQQIGGKLNVTVRGGYSILEFGVEQLDGSEGATSTPIGRLDGHLSVSAILDYSFNEWFSVGIGNDLDWRATNSADVVDGTNFSFVRNETLVIASIHY